MSVPGARQGVTRVETDEAGSLELPFAALYGVATARATLTPPISGISIGQFPDLIRALALVKKSVARTNASMGMISLEKALVIEKVCDEILSGQHHHHFLIDVLQGGASYATNMNINEVVANRGLELMGHHCGDYEHLHPSKDVDLSQAADVVYATAIRLALTTAMLQLIERLLALGEVIGTNSNLRNARNGADAPPAFYSNVLAEDIERLREGVRQLSQISLAVSSNAEHSIEGFEATAIAELASQCGLTLISASYALTADAGVFVQVSGCLKRVATRLSTIAIDLLGPTIDQPLPRNERAVPALLEMINQVAIQVVGIDATISFAAEAGRLQRNAYDPVISYSVLQAITMLRNAADNFRLHCLESERSNRDRRNRGPKASNSNDATSKR